MEAYSVDAALESSALRGSILLVFHRLSGLTLSMQQMATGDCGWRQTDIVITQEWFYSESYWYFKMEKCTVSTE